MGVHHAADPDGVHLHLRGGHVPLQSFENPSDAYAWYCGKWVSKFMDIFSIIMIGGIGLEKVTDVLRAVIYAGSPHIYF